MKSLTTGLLFGLMLVTSCQTELLDPVPQTVLSDKVVFDDPNKIQQQVNGLYAGLKQGSFLVGRYFVYNDVRADEFLNVTSNLVTGFATYNHSLQEGTDEVNTLWSTAYNAINRSNLFLDGMQANAAKFVEPIFPANYATTANQLIAEARFVRAVSYFYLLQLYARPYLADNGASPGLPLRLRGETGSANNDLARSTVQEVYNQILDDLNFAEQNLPLNYGTNAASAFTNTTRAHRNTAIAFKTKVYLTMGRYNDVITEADKIVSAAAPFAAASGVPHVLSANIADVFTLPATTPENIFSLPFTTLNAPGTQNGLGFYYLPNSVGNGGGEYRLNPAGIIGNTTAWPANDARRSQLITVANGEVYLGKFRAGTPFLDNTPILRYAEVLLNLAEARARASANSVDARALALLNSVRTRSGSPAYTDADVTTSAQLVAAIMTERRIEFLGEGHRSWNLLRTLSPIPGKSNVSEILPSASNYIWPIPSSEINNNRLIVRN